jgi:hypothetical protein
MTQNNIQVGDKLSDQKSGRDMYKVIDISEDKCTLERHRYNPDRDDDVWYEFTVSIEKVKEKLKNNILMKY